MRKKSFILFLLLISHVSLFSQNSLTGDALLEKQIYETGFIHAPLPLDTSRSFEENVLKKRYYPVNRLQKQTVQTDGPIPEQAVWLSLMRNPYPAKVVFV